MILTPGGGPIGGPTSNDGTGLRHVDAIRFQAPRGRRTGAPLPGPEADALIGHRIAEGEALRYATWPDLDADLSFAATWIALELVLEDGTHLMATGARDQYGAPADARGRGEARLAHPRQWNDVLVDLGAGAGRRIAAVLLVADAPGAAEDAAGGGEARDGLAPDADAGIAPSISGWIDPPALEQVPVLPDPTLPATDLVALVDTRRGTNASGDFSRGNTLPLAALPNGFVFWTPVTDARSSRWPYEYQRRNDARNRPLLQGIGISHAPSPWMGDRNQLFLAPETSAEPLGDPAARAVPFAHEDETARPDLYRVRRADGMLITLSPTDHGAILHLEFPPDAAGRHLVLEGIDEQCGFTADGPELSGWVDNGPDGEGRTRMFLSAQIDPAPETTGPVADAPMGTIGTTDSAETDAPAGALRGALALTFAPGTTEVTVRLATSFIGTEQARRTRALELDGRGLAEVREDAHRAWSERLGVIRPSGASLPQLRTLYGCLYRLNLYPNSQAENAGSAEQPRWVHASPVLATTGPASATRTNAAVRPGRIQVNHGFWDTYRTAWPAYALLYPDLAGELVDGFVQHAREGGWIARWSSPGYADLMTGTSSDVAFADAHARGVELPDPLGAYQAGLRNATVVPEHPAVGRKGLATSLYTGYVATDVHESVSWALEGYLNDAGLAGMAERLAADPATPEDRGPDLRAEARYLRRRSLGYVHLFDPAIGFFQGRRPDGAFAQDPGSFDPCAWGGDFTETNAWNFAFHVPHDPEGLATLHGGREGLLAVLEEFFATPETGLAVGGYGGVIHEMTEARDVRMGQFGFSNQPSHHIPFMFTRAGAPHRTQEITREVLQRLFTGEEIGQGYPGDEDNGEMSAWYVLAALGLYPLRMGEPVWELTAPLFPDVGVRPLGGEPFTVSAEGQSPDAVHIRSVRVRGAEHRVPAIDHADLHGRIEVALTAQPARWGSDPADAAPSPSAPGRRPEPWRDLTVPGTGEHPELLDDDARTEAHLGEASPAAPVVIPLAMSESARPRMLTLTSGAAEGGDPIAWRLEGQSADGAWHLLDERSGESFPWRRQLRPFAIGPQAPSEAEAQPESQAEARDAPSAPDLLRCRLVITRSAGPLVLAGIELLV